MEKSPWNIEWSDALSMHNPEIDAEHQHFIGLVNELNSAIANQARDKVDILHIMHLIQEDAVAHFEHEERLFAERGFPSAQEHAQIHAAIINKVEQEMNKLQVSQHTGEWVEIGLRIKKLLVDHVLREDTQYIEYLRTDGG